jgi:hypothetical protein
MSDKTGPDAYARIMLAARRGKGLRLSADDARSLSRDDAVSQAAINLLCEKCQTARPTRWGCRHQTYAERRAQEVVR